MKLYFTHLAWVLLTFSVFSSNGQIPSLDILNEWNVVDFGFPSENDRAQALASGNLVPENASPIDMAPQYHRNGSTRVFTTIPRLGKGIPYSLATVSDNGKTLQAYPDYSWHSSHGSDCDGIASAFRVALTPCNQMWVIDSGMIQGQLVCAPQLLLFDLATDRLVHRYRFNETVYTPRASLFITPAFKVDDPPPHGNCQRTTVYVADTNFHGLVVYDQAQNASWRTEHRFMYPDPDFGKHEIANESFILMDGIFGLSVVEPNLYFHPLASRSQYKVPLSILADRSSFENFVGSHADEFQKVGKRESQCAMETVDSKGNIFCVNYDPISLHFWNVKTPYKKQYLHELSNNEEVLQFVCGMKVVKNMKGKDELWLLSNRYMKIGSGTPSSNEVIFRILRRSLDDIDAINAFA